VTESTRNGKGSTSCPQEEVMESNEISRREPGDKSEQPTTKVSSTLGSNQMQELPTHPVILQYGRQETEQNSVECTKDDSKPSMQQTLSCPQCGQDGTGESDERKTCRCNPVMAPIGVDMTNFASTSEGNSNKTSGCINTQGEVQQEPAEEETRGYDSMEVGTAGVKLNDAGSKYNDSVTKEPITGEANYEDIHSSNPLILESDLKSNSITKDFVRASLHDNSNPSAEGSEFTTAPAFSIAQHFSKDVGDTNSPSKLLEDSAINLSKEFTFRDSSISSSEDIAQGTTENLMGKNILVTCHLWVRGMLLHYSVAPGLS